MLVRGNSLLICCIPACPENRYQLLWISDYLFKDACIANSQMIKMCLLPGQRVVLLTALDNNVSHWRKEEACLLLRIRDSNSWSSGFLTCNATHGLHRPGSICITPIGLGSEDNGHKYVDVHGYCCAESNQVLCLWSGSLMSSAGSMKLWQANSLVWK